MPICATALTRRSMNNRPLREASDGLTGAGAGCTTRTVNLHPTVRDSEGWLRFPTASRALDEPAPRSSDMPSCRRPAVSKTIDAQEGSMQGGSPPGAAHNACDVEPDDDASGPWSRTMDREDRVLHLAKAIELDVIPRLVAAHRPRSREAASNDAGPHEIDRDEVATFTRHVIAGDDVAIWACVERLRASGFHIEAFYGQLLGGTARRLGELWEDDECDFATVTIGLGRLQRLLRELSPAFGAEVGHPANGRRVLLVRAPNEQHSFGLSMVAEFFRLEGWEVAGAGAGAPDDPAAAVRREWFDVVGFSAGSEARVEWLAPCIEAVRRKSRNRQLAVLVGGPAFLIRPTLVAEVGADATAVDGHDAPRLAEGLISGRVTSV